MFNKSLRLTTTLLISAALVFAVSASWPSPNTASAAQAMGRVAGEDRFDTAARVSLSRFSSDGSATTAVIASGRNYPDALSGVSLAFLADGPLLLTEPDYLPTVTHKELTRSVAYGSTVYVLGGEEAISSAVDADLIARGYTVQRVAGATRYGTSSNVAAEIDRLPGATPQDHAFFVSGTSFADALAVSPLAAIQEEVILLSPHDALSTEVKAYLDATPSITTATVIGGTDAIGDSVVDELSARGLFTARIGGADRYDTARLIADTFAAVPGAPEGVGLASGENFPDALSAGAHLAGHGLPLLLTQKNNIGCVATADFLAQYADRIHGGFVFGGLAVVSGRTDFYAEMLIDGTATPGNCDTSDPASVAGSLGYDGIDKDCDDFASQNEADDYFVFDGGTVGNNVDGLDADGDGVACETHVY